MASRTVTTVLKLNDQMSNKLKKIQKVSDKTSKSVQDKATLIGAKFQAVGNKMSAVGRGLTAGVTVPLVGLGTVAVNKFAEVDKTMALVESTMGKAKWATADLNEEMKKAAANSVYGMDDAAQAALNFARGGWDAEQAAYALAPAMALAAGEGGDLETVSAGLMATMNSFGANADEAATYADVFANACNNSALDVNSLADSMSVAAPIFKTSGQDVEDAALAMGVMANAGTDASVAANALKTGIARLASPAKSGAAWMERLGINAFDSHGNLKEMTDLQKELSGAFSTLTSEEKEAAAAAIFGKNQMAPWLSLIQTAPSDVEDLAEKLKKTGTAAEMSDAMMSGFGGSLEKIKSSVDVLVTTIGEKLAPYISLAADKIQALLDKFNSLSPEQQDLIVKIGLIAAAIGPVLMIAGKVIAVIGIIIPKITFIIGLIGKVISVLKIIIMVVSVITGLPAIAVVAIVAAVAIVIALIIKFRKQIWQGIQFVWNKLKDIAGKIKNKIIEVIDWARGKVEDIKEKLGEIKDNVVEKFTEIGEGIKSALLAPFEWISGKIEAFKEGVGSIVDKVKDTAGAVKDKVTGNATGTAYWRGGQTMVGENGPEMVELPAGSKVYPHTKTQNMTKSAPVINISLNIQGNVIGNEDFANMITEKAAGKLIAAMAN